MHFGKHARARALGVLVRLTSDDQHEASHEVADHSRELLILSRVGLAGATKHEEAERSRPVEEWRDKERPRLRGDPWIRGDIIDAHDAALDEHLGKDAVVSRTEDPFSAAAMARRR